MTKLRTLTKAMVGASVVSLFAASNAFAGGTMAGTPVDNTFTLDYKVDGTDQPTIDTSDNPGGTDTPTTFIVDRVINLTVATNGDETVAPGAQDEVLAFTVTNTGNDVQAYSFDVVNEGGDDFETGGLNILYIPDNGTGGVCDATDVAAAIAGGTAYTPGSGAASVDVGIDEVLCVVVQGDIPVAPGVTDGNTSDLSLVASTLIPSTAATGAGNPVVEDTDGNNDAEAENVFADGDGGTGNEGDTDAAHSATATFTVNSPELIASKSVTVFNQDGLGNCDLTDTAVPGGYHVPGACVEYIITVENQGATIAATDIDVTDILPEELTFVDAEILNWGDAGAVPVLPAGTLAEPAGGVDCAGASATACTVALTGAGLPAATTATIRIHALVK